MVSRSLVMLLVFAAAVTTAGAQVSDDLAARGEHIASLDALAVELRNQQSDGPVRRGFDIGMAAAEGQTLPGPSKDSLGASLPPDERRGFTTAVSFSLERNRNGEAAALGAAIALADPSVANVRARLPSVLAKLGFDIATALFGDPALGASGNTAMGPVSTGIRNALSSTTQGGFDYGWGFYSDRNKAAAVARRPKLICRGGSELRITTAPSDDDPQRLGLLTLFINFNRSAQPSDAAGANLQPGQCNRADRALTDNEPTQIRTTVPADNPQWALLRDNSPNAAERFVDDYTLQAYLRNPKHYWMFPEFTNAGTYFQTANRGIFWKPGSVLFAPSPTALKKKPVFPGRLD